MKTNVVRWPGAYRRQQSTRQVPVKPVKHRRPPRYVEASFGRAATIAAALNRCAAIDRKALKGFELLVAFALDDARSAGFSAGVAFGRSL